MSCIIDLKHNHSWQFAYPLTRGYLPSQSWDGGAQLDERDAGGAAGRLDVDSSRANYLGPLSRRYHRYADAILHVQSGNEVLQLCDDFGMAVLRPTIDVDQRRVADEIGGGAGDLHGNPFELLFLVARIIGGIDVLEFDRPYAMQQDHRLVFGVGIVIHACGHHGIATDC
jgi:hypothetical protein